MDPRKVINALTKFVGTFGGISICMMFILMSIDVTARYIFNASLSWVYELSEYLMVACIYLGLAYTDTVGGHIRIDFLLLRFPSKLRTIIELINHLFMFGFMVILTRQAWILFEESWRLGRANMGAAQTPVAPSQLIMFIGCLLFSVHLLMRIVEIISRQQYRREMESG